MSMKLNKANKIQGLRRKGRKSSTIVSSFNDPKITNEKITTQCIFQIKTLQISTYLSLMSEILPCL